MNKNINTIFYKNQMTLYIIQSTGEMTECENKEIALASSNVLIVISHLQKRIYNWIGSQSSPQSKFACARETSILRMELGYKIVNLEESDTNDEFLEAVDEACNIKSDSSSKPKPKPVKPISKAEPKSKTKVRTDPVTETKTDPTAEIKTEPVVETKSVEKPKSEVEEEKSAKVKETTESKEEVTRRYNSKAVEISILDVEHVIKQLEVLPPLGNSIRDYIIINDTLYIAPENLEKPDTESRVKLPDGSFVADDYIPRLFLENGKIIAVELWREN